MHLKLFCRWLYHNKTEALSFSLKLDKWSVFIAANGTIDSLKASVLQQFTLKFSWKETSKIPTRGRQNTKN